MWNYTPGRTAAGVNLEAAPCGFKVTGDAARDSESGDWAMFSDEGNQAVAAMVETARLKCRTGPEAAVFSWLRAERQRIVAGGHPEVHDTMVRETIQYALGESWLAAYGHPFPRLGLLAGDSPGDTS
jgi:hypothetical protein